MYPPSLKQGKTHRLNEIFNSALYKVHHVELDLDELVAAHDGLRVIPPALL